jgi:hypothetical protein
MSVGIVSVGLTPIGILSPHRCSKMWQHIYDRQDDLDDCKSESAEISGARTYLLQKCNNKLRFPIAHVNEALSFLLYHDWMMSGIVFFLPLISIKGNKQR